MNKKEIRETIMLALDNHTIETPERLDKIVDAFYLLSSKEGGVTEEEIEALADKITTGIGVGQYMDKPPRVANFMLGFKYGQSHSNSVVTEISDEDAYQLLLVGCQLEADELVKEQAIEIVKKMLIKQLTKSK